MSYTIKDDDYLELWKYFRDKASEVRDNMTKIVTWEIGFSAALLGFSFLKLTAFNPEETSLSLPVIVIVTSVSGLVMCIYTLFSINEYSKYIRNNWKYAEICKDKINGMNEILENQERPKHEAFKIWDLLILIVSLFALSFLALLIYSLTR